MTPTPKPDTRITLTHGRATYRVQPKNAQRVRDALFALDRGNARKFRASPGGNGVQYPDFELGMTTAEYIRRFHTMNDLQKWVKVGYVHADRAAPMLDPLTPEVQVEPDPDYVPTVKTKRKSPSAAQLAGLVREALTFAPAEWSARALELLA